VGGWGGISGLAVAVGPVVGGAIADGLSWQWIFWLNVPVGLLVIPFALRRLSESFGPRPELDLVGLGLAGAGALGITWGIVRANSVGWGSAEIVASLAAGLVLVGAFLAWERRAASPMIPLALFRDRGSRAPTRSASSCSPRSSGCSS
jgi:MFS family permease